MEKLTKITQPIFLIALVIGLLLVLKGFLIPFSYGLLIALIIYPICKKLENKRIPRSVAIFISIMLVMVVLGCVIFIFILQIKVLEKEIPELIIRFNQFLSDIQKWLVTNWGLSIIEQHNLISSTEKNLSSNIGKIITGSFSIAADTIFNIVVIPIYSILILYYRNILVDFVSSLFGEKYIKNVPAILSETIHVYYNYIKGMVWVYFIVGILNSIGLLLLGVDYAILLGMATAFMTIIPYVGIIISSILPISLVWIETDNVLYPLGVIGIFSIVQYLEANIIFPYIVGKQLGVNALVSITSIFIGGIIWGVSGMILFLPFVALLKIISSHVEILKPFHKLLNIPK